MFKKKEKDELLVEEQQYRAVISFLPEKKAYRASVQRRVGIDEWVKVRCGLKNVNFATSKEAEKVARQKIKVQKSLDDKGNNTISYIIYDD